MRNVCIWRIRSHKINGMCIGVSLTMAIELELWYIVHRSRRAAKKSVHFDATDWSHDHDHIDLLNVNPN